MRPLTIWNAYLAAGRELIDYETWLPLAGHARPQPPATELERRSARADRRRRLRDRCELRLAVVLGALREVGGFAAGVLSSVALGEIRWRTAGATPGPWYVRRLDDTHAMSLVAVSTVPDTGRGERWPDFDHGEFVAATLIQAPRYVAIADERWDGNAAFIAHAREDLPRLLAEIDRRRAQLAPPVAQGPPPGAGEPPSDPR